MTQPGDRFGLRAYARGAARALGWRYVEPDRDHSSEAYARMRDPETGAEISLFCNNYPASKLGRVEVRGIFPKGAGGHDTINTDEAPRISVRMQLGPDHFAAEVRRRFLPGYWPLWQEAAKRSTASLIADDGAEKLLGELLETIPDARRSTFGRADHSGSFYAHGFYGKVDVWSRGEVDFEIKHLPEDLAREVAKIIATAVRRIHDRGDDRGG